MFITVSRHNGKKDSAVSLSTFSIAYSVQGAIMRLSKSHYGVGNLDSHISHGSATPAGIKALAEIG